MSFLTAEWRKLALANYVIDPKLLKNYIPAGTELDLWDNKCYISLVGFMFLNTKLMGVKIPFHSNFEEVNLRFYVKRFQNGEWKRGVVFIKEIVPKPALTFVANAVYKENYITLPMKHSWVGKNKELHVEYAWKMDNWNHLKLTADDNAQAIQEGSDTEFITEHYWGYAKVNDHTTNEYEVKHPKWNCYKVKGYTIQVDFGKIYGSEFSLLSNQKPDSVMLAEGSKISVESKEKINTKAK